MRRSSVKALHAMRSEIKVRMLQRNVVNRTRLRQTELSNCRKESDENSRSEVSDAYAFVGAEFQCDVCDPAVQDFLLALEEEIRNEQLVSLFDESQEADWEAYYSHLTQS
ncbi:hypothetical protein DQ04_03071060 [Trypanosoma grayi]|uniref:hypothetical protein n=1 Tax=Trypanosoma grayi TaxID=71804 RepID=UPI0004F42518|nr:hypothetical protein DQ04_03071060 [Trypanosoma grayi]KEG11000.1 hypothetical protein DQ04_03071060 [Trypanosoma grayi]